MFALGLNIPVRRKSNNIYIDNLNISGVLAANEIAEANYNVAVYPNPTSGSASIDYFLKNEQHIKIVLTDILGHSITELTNNSRSAGQQHITFNSNDLAGGIYFIKIIADNNLVATKKLVVIH